MEFIEKVLSLGWDPYIIMLVLASGFFQKKYLVGIKIIDKMSDAHKTLFVSGLFSAIYIGVLVITKHENLSDKMLGFVLSYIFATSFYEILIKPFSSSIEKFFGITKDQ